MASKTETIDHATHAYAFKNGYCLIVKQFSIPTQKESSSLKLMDLPENPVHGTFSIQAAPNVKIYSMRSKKIDHSVETKCKTIEELIQANLERDNVELLTKGLEVNPIWIREKIYMNTEEENPKESKTSVSIGQKQKTVIVETAEQEIIGFPLESVISIRGKNMQTTLPKCSRKNCLSITYKNKSGAEGVGFMKYLTFGITWVPSYEIDLITSTESDYPRMLRLSLKCTLLNDNEDIDIDHVSCIVGHPNLLPSAEIIDPLLNSDSVQEFLNKMQRTTTPSAAWEKEYATSRFAMRMNPSSYVMVLSDDENETKGNNSGEDFHFYKFKNIPLRKNERISLPVFNVQLPYKDVYQCIIDPKEQSTGSGKAKPRHRVQAMSAEVWHAIEFENTSEHILTTAPVLVTQDNHQFICQETLPFALKNSQVFIHLTKAPAIRVTHEEKAGKDSSGSASPETVKIFKKAYVKESWTGSIRVTNGVQETVAVVIKIQLDGDVTDYSLSPKVDGIQKGKAAIDRMHNITWELELSSQETKTITYSRADHRLLQSDEH